MQDWKLILELDFDTELERRIIRVPTVNSVRENSARLANTPKGSTAFTYSICHSDSFKALSWRVPCV